MHQRLFSHSAVSTGAFFVLACVSGVAQSPYKVIDHWKVGGTGGWDYLLADGNSQRLYLTHGDRVDVLDTKTGKSVGAITGLKGTHGVVLDDRTNLGYISDGRANQVVIFDRGTLGVVGTIPAGTNPDGMTLEPTTRTLWAFNGKSNNVTVIDLATRKVVATTNLPGKPEFPEADGKGNVFVNIEDKNVIVKLSAASHEVVEVLPLSNCESPSGMAIDTTHKRLFSVCDGGKMAVVDTATGKQLATAAIGDGPDAAGYNGTAQLAFSSNGDGTLSIIDAAHGYKSVQTVPTAKGARTMSYDPSTDRVYLVTAGFGPQPAPTADQPRPRPPILPGTFEVLVVGR